MKIKALKQNIGRLCQAIEFRILLVLAFLAGFLYPFIQFQNLEDPWVTYNYIFKLWLILIVVLFLLSVFSDETEFDDDGETS